MTLIEATLARITSPLMTTVLQQTQTRLDNKTKPLGLPGQAGGVCP
jgi:hypothetical protein